LIKFDGTSDIYAAYKYLANYIFLVNSF